MTSAFARGRSAWAAVGLVALVALSGCAPAWEPSPTPTATAAESPTPSPVPQAVTAPVPPFGGDCSNVLTDEEVKTYLGDQAYLYRASRAIGDPVATAGGLTCHWDTFDGVTSGRYIQVTALPESVVGDDIRSRYAAPACLEGTYDGECEASDVRSGVWMLVRFVPETSGSVPVELDEILARVLDRSAPYPAPVAVDARADRWRLPTCEAVREKIDFAAVLGSNAGLTFGGEGQDVPPPIDEITTEIGVRLWCHWSVDGTTQLILVSIMPGGWWDSIDAQAALGGEATPVAGADSATIISTGESTELTAASGSNAVRIIVSAGLDPVGVAEDLLAALD